MSSIRCLYIGLFITLSAVRAKTINEPNIDKRSMSFQQLNPNDLFELKRSWLPLDRRSISDMASPWLGDQETVEMRKRMDFPWQFDGEQPYELQPIMAEKRDWLKRSLLNY